MALPATALRCVVRVFSTGAAGRWVVLAILGAVLLGGCSTPGGIELFPQGASMEAPMRPTGGSAVTGSVIVGPTSSGVAMRIALANLAVGPYRVVIHANGNCTSPNAFSAGPPLVLPGGSKHLLADTPPGLSGPDGNLMMVVRIPGLKIEGPDGIAGKSVVVHMGAQGSLDAQPGVPNDRVACGVIGAPVFRLL